MSEIIDVTPRTPGDQRDQSLRTVGHISYALHAVVAIGAVLPGVQASVALLVVAFILDIDHRQDHGAAPH